jgi:prepilin-type N-terminal cleavage/methylation domain-containing protein
LNSHNPARQQLTGQRGFSFIETLIVLAVLSVVVVQQLRTSELTSVDRIATGMVEKFQRVQRASMRYYSMTDSWPDGIDLLVEKNLLTQEETTNSWGKPFEFKVEGQESQDLLISSDLTEVRYASRVAGRLPRASLSVPDAAEASGVSGVGEVSNAGTVANALTTKVTSRIDPPGHEAAHDKLLHLDGTKKMKGTLDLDGWGIENGGDIKASKLIDGSFYLDPNDTSILNEVQLDSLALKSNVVVGGECSKKYIGTTSVGTFASCVGNIDSDQGKWRIPHELPVGAIYIAVTTDDPSESLGYGRWEPFSKGRVLVGQKDSQGSSADKECTKFFNEKGEVQIVTNTSLVTSDNPAGIETPPAKCWWYALGYTGGSLTDSHVLTEAEMPAHQHSNRYNQQPNTDEDNFKQCPWNASGKFSGSINSTKCLFVTQRGASAGSPEGDFTETMPAGSDVAHEHDIVQPSIIVKIWKRIE